MSKSIQLKTENDEKIYPYPYLPVGFVYISIVDINPSTYFGGEWEQITGDCYLKIVTSNAGETGGTSSSHKIPISSIPGHTHTANFSVSGTGTNGEYFPGGVPSSGDIGGNSNVLKSTGGGQAYYPYYFGVYVWVRTA